MLSKKTIFKDIHYKALESIKLFESSTNIGTTHTDFIES